MACIVCVCPVQKSACYISLFIHSFTLHQAERASHVGSLREGSRNIIELQLSFQPSQDGKTELHFRVSRGLHIHCGRVIGHLYGFVQTKLEVIQ